MRATTMSPAAVRAFALCVSVFAVGCFPDPEAVIDDVATDSTSSGSDAADSTTDTLAPTDASDDADTGTTDVADGAMCGDDDDCDRSDLCQPERCVDGACVAQDPVVCTASTVVCWENACNPATGACEPVPQTGTTCDDENACTTVDACANGVCVGGDPVVCEPVSDCHDAGECEPSDGSCSTPVKPRGSACEIDDGAGFCTEGTCYRRQVAIGNETCLLFDNKIRCWHDQLASEGTTWSFEREVAEIGVGVFFRCVRFTDGGVRCWGNSGNVAIYGQGPAGVTNIEDVDAMEDIHVGGKAVGLSVAGSVACVRLADGRPQCWGNGSNGVLGTGSTRAVGDDEVPSDVPIQIGSIRFSKVSTGGGHTCGLTVGGAVRCWGYGGDGQLGYGNTDTLCDSIDESPQSIGDVPVGFEVAQIAVGGSFTCAMAPSGAVRCWGRGQDGQLGNGLTATFGDDEPPSANVGVALGGPARAIAAGSSNACAVLAGGVRCWGAGGNGVNGQGSPDNVGDDESPSSVSFVSLNGTATSVVLGRVYGLSACAALSSGGLNCWGQADELGYGDDVDRGGAPGTMPPGLVPFE